MLTLEFQYVAKCPIVEEMAQNINRALAQLNFEVKFSEKVLIEYSDKIESRGCPTLLVNGRDLQGVVKCDMSKPFCRIYKDGIPSVEQIKNFINWNY